jgi:dTDP-glucose 4,6-dehydratase
MELHGMKQNYSIDFSLLRGQKMQNVLITGGAGFIGSNFIHYLLEKKRGLQIINLDALTYAGSLNNLNNIADPDRHLFIEGDICDQDKVEHLIHEYHIDTIVHFAAESHVDRSISGPSPFIQTNIIGTFTLLEVARKIWLEESWLPIDQVRFHHVSTDEVYGSLEMEDDAFKETNLYVPNSPYTASKTSSDHLVRA